MGVPEALENSDLAHQARDPALVSPDTLDLGACRGSHWPRTCSYWASLHSMAYRADVLGSGRLFLQAAITVLAGGATMCGGCTLHLHDLHYDVLSPAVRNDLGPVH